MVLGALGRGPGALHPALPHCSRGASFLLQRLPPTRTVRWPGTPSSSGTRRSAAGPCTSVTPPMSTAICWPTPSSVCWVSAAEPPWDPLRSGACFLPLKAARLGGVRGHRTGAAQTEDEMCGEDGKLRIHRAGCAVDCMVGVSLHRPPALMGADPSHPLGVSSPWGVHADSPCVLSGSQGGKWF